MAIQLTLDHTEISVTDTEKGRSMHHVDQDADFVNDYSDVELVTLINDRLDAIDMSATVSESDIPTHPDESLQNAINNATSLNELKSALTDSTHSAKSRGRNR